MSKRSQTTALPKETPKPVPPTEGGEVRREANFTQTAAGVPLPRAEREHEIQRWVIIGTIAAVVSCCSTARRNDCI